MSFLPIVGRELRGASRRRGTYWVRTVVGAISVVIGILIFLAKIGTPAAQSGRAIFEGLSGLLLVYGLLSGRGLTVDCISVEKREGTLGLLFLTDLKGYDVVLGKLVATSLNGFYALLAVMPVLAFSMLLGAVADSEFWRMVLVLVDTFLFSLAIGIFCSAVSHDARRASAANFALLLLFVVVLPAVAGLLSYYRPGRPMMAQWFYPCPAFPFYLSLDPNYKLRPEDFWLSVGAIHSLTWLMVMLASWIVPHTWQDKPVRAGKARWRDLWHAWSYGPAAARPSFRKRMLDVNAFYWLAGRARFKPLHVWVFLGLVACWWTWSLLRAGDVWWSGVIVIVMSLILNSTLKLWITIEAGQQLAEDQRMGTLELLLPTPLGARDILGGQWLALRRQFLRPLLVVIIAELLLTYISIRHEGGGLELVCMVLAGIVALIADASALACVSMRSALTARSATRASIGTVTRILVLPWAAYGAIQLMIGVWNILWPEKSWEPQWRFDLGLWFGLGIGADLTFGMTAGHQLLSDFRRLALQRFESKPSRLNNLLTGPAAVGQTSGDPAAPTRPAGRSGSFFRRRRVAFAVVLFLILGGTGFLLRQHRQDKKIPPPVMVYIARSNTPLSVVVGQQSLLVLPDGSLWRWGQGSGWQPGREAPEQVGQSHNWVEVNGGYFAGVGIQHDGSIWGWGAAAAVRYGRPISFDAEAVQMDPGHDWMTASSAGSSSMAIKKDGSLWVWPDSATRRSNRSDDPNSNNAVQVGTNHDWKDVRSLGNGFLGLRSNGTLWTSGRTMSVTNGVWRQSPYSPPVQLCSETNWSSLEKGIGYWAWTTSGALWSVGGGAANAYVSIASKGRLFISNSRPGHFALVFHQGGPTPRLWFYQVHDDGTLWESSQMMTFAPPSGWHRFGSRTNWVSIWSGAGTALGLTADGTIWTWGTDWSKAPEIPFSARLKSLQDQVAKIFSPTTAAAGIGPVPAYQELPRPLMRLVMTVTNQSANLIGATNTSLNLH